MILDLQYLLFPFSLTVFIVTAMPHIFLILISDPVWPHAHGCNIDKEKKKSFYTGQLSPFPFLYLILFLCALLTPTVAAALPSQCAFQDFFSLSPQK